MAARFAASRAGSTSASSTSMADACWFSRAVARFSCLRERPWLLRRGRSTACSKVPSAPRKFAMCPRSADRSCAADAGAGVARRQRLHPRHVREGFGASYCSERRMIPLFITARFAITTSSTTSPNARMSLLSRPARSARQALARHSRERRRRPSGARSARSHVAQYLLVLEEVRLVQWMPARAGCEVARPALRARDANHDCINFSSSASESGHIASAFPAGARARTEPFAAGPRRATRSPWQTPHVTRSIARSSRDTST